MNPVGPSNPFHISRAYGVQTPTVRPIRETDIPTQLRQTTRPEGRTDAIDIRTDRTDPTQRAAAKPNVAKLLAGLVPGGIDFSGDTPRPTVDAIPMYRHPADKNAAATGVHAGRVLDVKG